jgi:pilus assembly protein CpaB
MAQSATTASGTRINRRFLFLAVILGVLAFVLVYAGMSRSGGDSGAGSGDVPVVVAASTIPPGTRITEEMVQVQNFTTSNAPFQSLEATELVVGQVARYPINEGEPVLASKLVDTSVTSAGALTYILEPGKRGIAFRFDQLIGVSRLVLPGDHVDVLWVPFKDAPAFVLFADVEVSAVSLGVADIAPAAPGLTEGDATPTTGDRTRTSDPAPDIEADTATLMLSAEEATNLLCAEAFAEKNEGQIRLALRSFGDNAPLQTNAPTCPPIDLFRQFNPEG